MIKEIEIYNVNFGDCFICSGDDGKMLVDFGSTKEIHPLVKAEVNNSLMSAKEKIFMLSHFHDDHKNGIADIDANIKFNRIYLPNFFDKDILTFEFACLLRSGLSSQSGAMALNLLMCIPSLAKNINSETVIDFCKRGDHKTNNGLDDLRILWPETDKFSYDFKSVYSEMLKDIEEAKQKAVDVATTKYHEALFRISSRDYSQEKETDAIELGKIVDNFIEEFCEDKKVIRLGLSLSRKISKLQNEISLCFDNVRYNGGTNSRNVLFLGDLPRKFFKIINGDKTLPLAEKYSAIKVPHHGTKNYYVEDLPESTHLMISNGKANSGWEISTLYGLRYNDRIFHCTNYTYACEFEKACRYCESSEKGQGNCGISISFTLTV